MLQRGSILTLSDNNKYVVIDQMNMENSNYIYLVDINNNKNIIFGKFEGSQIQEVLEPNLLNRLIIEFGNHLSNNLDEINKIFKEN